MILVSGYYGFDNLGDEAILAALVADLLALGVGREDIVVLSNNPAQTEKAFGVKALPRYDVKQFWRRLGSARLFISGGGSLLQDVTSKRSIPYYLGLVELALLRKVPVVMYGQGLGPVRNRFLRYWVKRAFQRSSSCSVRDEGSLQFLKELGIPEGNIELCADPVFQQELAAKETSRSRRILLNLRPYRGWEQQRREWVQLVMLWQDEGFSVEFVPLGPGDQEMGKSLQEQCLSLDVRENLTLGSLGAVFAGADIFVSMRLHGLIFSVLNDCQAFGLNYDPKVAAICQQLNVPYWELDALTGLGKKVEQVLAEADAYRQEYRKALVGLRQGALKNREMLDRVLR